MILIGFYFSLVCNCDTNGALPEICDNNGTCLCKDNTNDDCSECLEGYYGNVTNNENCLGCPCPTANNTHAASCFVDTDNMTICMCNKAYTGTNCEECSEGYFGDALVKIYTHTHTHTHTHLYAFHLLFF